MGSGVSHVGWSKGEDLVGAEETIKLKCLTYAI